MLQVNVGTVGRKYSIDYIMRANLQKAQMFGGKCLAFSEGKKTQTTVGASVAGSRFAGGYGSTVESFSHSEWLNSDTHCFGGQKHKWVQQWMEPGSLCDS